MRISDWSSDVCSSDLGSRAMARTGAEAPDAAVGVFGRIRAFFTRDSDDADGPTLHDREPSLRRGKASAVGEDSYVDPEDLDDDEKLGRGSCRGRGCQYGENSVVDVSLKKTKKKRI